MQIGKCRLCLQEKELINRSHILSDFFYRDIYGEDHEAYVIPLSSLGTAKKVQTGEFEGGILCQDCDNRILGGYEKYGAAFIFGTQANNVLPNVRAENQVHPDGELKSTHIVNIDYAALKLFLLSLLWRASISTRPFFQHVNLGKYEEEVRQMLLLGDPGTQMKFPCLVNIVTGENKDISRELIPTPTKFRTENCIGYLFPIGRMVFRYFVSPTGVPDFINQLAVSEDGKMRVIHLDGKASDKHMKFILGDALHDHLLKT
ncbi:MAG: hypothetical protein QY323_01360 [Patescibacteria group bacterium]|nr:MAG: hypothetical protein QY323_01360 [Patescibacteria group bacterium]